MATTPITVVAANIRSNPRQGYVAVRNRIRQAIALAGPSGFTMLSECDAYKETKSPLKRYRVSYMDIVKAEAKRYRKEVVGAHTEVPMIFDTAVWELIGENVIRVHGGLAGISPTRFINAPRVRHRRNKLKVAPKALHPVSKGHYPAGHRGITQLAWRREHLAMYMADLKDDVGRDLKDGYLSIWAGDFNDPTPERVSTRQIPMYNMGLDHIFIAPNSKQRVGRITRIFRKPNTAMDHPILVARTTVTEVAQ